MSYRRTFLVLLLGSGALAAQSRPTSTHPVNHLAKETSPYLLQHARNPVDWYPWGKEALERSVREDKPIFLSIGYAACHWCHVMEHESFEDPAIAATMNRLFVCVKVDREERPDLDEIYMTAVKALTGRGGWPMSVWLTPKLEPFYAGTYFPPEDRHGMPGFARVLEHIDRLWREKRNDLAAHGRELASVVARHLAPVQTPGAVELAVVDRLVEESRRRYDREYGGWGDAPKFPHASELQLLLRHHARTGEPDSLGMVVQTLERMAKGGIYDQLGGGFHRYSTDRVWLVPHFEKMLYDNALLARVYAEAFTLTRRPLFARILRETLDWMLREMQQEGGGFSATQDADSEGEEGKFFVWQAGEIDAVLGDRAKPFRAHFGVEATGNWERTNVLHWVGEGDELSTELAKARAELLAVRGRRVHPATDDKVLSAWNGMAIAALAIGSRTLGEPRYLAAAQRCARFVLDQLGDGKGRLLRTWRHGEAKLQGYLEDHAFVAEALLELFQCDSDPRWLAAAKELCLAMQRSFRDEKDGSFFATAADHETLIARSKSVVEASQPSGVAMAVLAFAKLGALTGDEAFSAIGAAAIAGNRELLERGPSAAPSLLLGLEWQLGDPCEVVVAGAPDDPRTQALLARVHAAFPPHHVVFHVHAGNRAALAGLTQLVEGKEPRNGEPVAYVCRRGSCRAPVTQPEALVLR